MKKLLTLLAAIGTLSAHAQQAKLTGKVSDEKGEPLLQANVVIDASKGQATVTDFDGNYTLELPEGSYQVTFRYVGKEEVVKSVVLKFGQTVSLNVTLKEKERLMDVVVVTGSKYEKKLSEETVSLEVMKSNVLSNQNITDVQNGVQKIPGVTIADGQANIRGGSGWSYGAGSRVAVMYDDMLITTADADDAKWSMIPVENVEQIEVLKGAASAIYGSSALNGVINARTATPGDKPYTKVQSYVGFYEGPTKTREMNWWQGRPQYTAGLNFADRRKLGQWDLVTGFAYNNDRGWLDSSDNQDLRVNAKIRYRFKKIEGLSVGINALGYWSWGKTFFLWDSIGSKSLRPLAGTITEYDNNRYVMDPFITYMDKNNNKINLKYRWLNSSNVNSTGQGSIANRHILDFSYQRPFDISEKVKLNFIAGTGARIDKIAPPNNDSSYLYGNQPHNAYNASVFAQVDGKFFNRLNVTLGARYEYYEVDKRNSLKDLKYPLFRLGLNYQAAEATYIRGSFGQGFRFPSVAELFVTTAIGAFQIFPNVNLKPELGYSAELGIKQGFKFGKNSNAVGFVDVAGFWNQYNNMMEFMFGSFGDPNVGAFGAGFSSQNIGNARILGLDASVGAQVNIKDVEVNLMAGYTYINTRALNWDDPLTLFDYKGDTLRPGFQSAYKGSNAPAGLDTTRYITYGMTSSSDKNMLKYRPTHQLKLIFNVVHKRFDFNLDYQFIGYQQNIDYAFVSQFFARDILLLLTQKIYSFQGLKNYRDRLESQGYRGDNIVNIGIGYKPTDHFKASFIIKNVANWEWMPRPGRFEAPRSYTLQLAYQF